MNDTIDRAGCPALRHGTSRAYCEYGCRCPDARADHRRLYGAWRRRRLVALGRTYAIRIDATGTRRRLRALQVAGWWVEDIAAEVGVSAALLHRQIGQQVVQQATADRYAALYGRLRDRPGPHDGTRACLRARTAGYAPPWAWDRLDMDDPAAEPWYWGWDVDPVAVERALARARGEAVPAPALTVDERALLVSRVLREEREPAAMLGRLFAISVRQADRIVARGGVRRRHLRVLVPAWSAELAAA